MEEYWTSVSKWTDEFRFEHGVTPLSHYTYIFGASILYLITIYAVRYLTPKPMRFKFLQALHNLVLTVGSAVMLLGTLTEVYLRLLNGATMFDLFCDVGGTHAKGRLVFWAWIFHLSKIYEFIDTLFKAFRHDHLNFLHVYHHVLTLIVTWVGLLGEATFQWGGVVTNTFVHTFMYYYYFRTTLGYRPTWKKHLTTLQMVQFWFNTACLVLWLYVKHIAGYNCHANSGVIALTIFANVTFYVLFQRFYNRTYGNAIQMDENAHAKKNN